MAGAAVCPCPPLSLGIRRCGSPPGETVMAKAKPDELPPGSLEFYIHKTAEETARETLAALGPTLPIAKEWLSPKEAATWLGCHVVHLGKLRSESRGPRYVKLGKHVRYSLAGLRTFMASLPQEEDAA